MTITEETRTLRRQLKEWASDPEWSLLVRYELLPQKSSSIWYQRLNQRVGRLLRLLGLSRSRYCKQQWHAGLKHAHAAPEAIPLLIWAEGHERQFVRDACEGMKRLLGEQPIFLPVLVTDGADFAYFSRLGWLVEYLPDLSGEGVSYRERKRRYLAWRYREAMAVPLSAGLATREDWEVLVEVGGR